MSAMAALTAAFLVTLGGWWFAYPVDGPVGFYDLDGERRESRGVTGCFDGVAYILYDEHQVDAGLVVHELAHAVHCVETGDLRTPFGPESYPAGWVEGLSDYCLQPAETWACFAEQRPADAFRWLRSRE